MVFWVATPCSVVMVVT